MQHPKKIFINGRFLSQKITGVQRLAREIVKSLDQLIERGEIDRNTYSFTLLVPSGQIQFPLELKYIQIIEVGRLKGHAWEQIELPFFTGRNLLLSLCNTGPILKRNQIVNICDAAVFAYPEGFSFAFGTWYRLLYRILGRNTKAIATISEFSKQELIKYCGIQEKKFSIIYAGMDHFAQVTPDDSGLEKFHLEKGKYVLAVSSMNPNKNFAGIVAAIERIQAANFEIAIAGDTNNKVFATGLALSSDKVKLLGYVTDEQLKALYENAACFVYPSFYEGFGIPPLEAMSSGCPVIVSTAASIPEVCGEAALYCDPYNPQDIADKISLLMSDATLREALCKKGYVRSAQFTWDKCARNTFYIIQQVVD